MYLPSVGEVGGRFRATGGEGSWSWGRGSEGEGLSDAASALAEALRNPFVAASWLAVGRRREGRAPQTRKSHVPTVASQVRRQTAHMLRRVLKSWSKSPRSSPTLTPPCCTKRT